MSTPTPSEAASASKIYWTDLVIFPILPAGSVSALRIWVAFTGWAKTSP